MAFLDLFSIFFFYLTALKKKFSIDVTISVFFFRRNLTCFILEKDDRVINKGYAKYILFEVRSLWEVRNIRHLIQFTIHDIVFCFRDCFILHVKKDFI